VAVAGNAKGRLLPVQESGQAQSLPVLAGNGCPGGDDDLRTGQKDVRFLLNDLLHNSTKIHGLMEQFVLDINAINNSIKLPQLNTGVEKMNNILIEIRTFTTRFI
jgi:hypothetical protein